MTDMTTKINEIIIEFIVARTL